MDTNLWREIQPYIDFWMNGSEPSLTPHTSISKAQNDTKRTPTLHEPIGTPSIQQLAAGTHSNVTTITESDSSNDFMFQSSEQLRDIELIKTRYIVGKRAGKDLTDRDHGELILKKGDVITTAAVKAAEKNGKLVELIIHMVIDDFDN
ncbi:MAG: hypothetical protein OWR52_01545 [Acidibacillus sp.]|nr:hypothetical protein [Acidibacillus sp.]